MAILFLLTGTTAAQAASISTTLGNASSGLSDGDVPTTLQLSGIQSGQAAPFDTGIGNELFTNFSASWTFNYGIPIDPIGGAFIRIGIADHDSAASGDQVSIFSIDGLDLTADLNTAFEGHGGTDGEYNIYTIALSGSSLAALADGQATLQLTLQGPGLQTALPFLGGGVSETSFNGAHLVFSTLEITAVPLPGAAWLFGSGLLAIVWRGKRAAVGK